MTASKPPQTLTELEELARQCALNVDNREALEPLWGQFEDLPKGHLLIAAVTWAGIIREFHGIEDQPIDCLIFNADTGEFANINNGPEPPAPVLLTALILSTETAEQYRALTDLYRRLPEEVAVIAASLLCAQAGRCLHIAQARVSN